MTRHTRLALKRRLEADWKPTNTEGYDPNLADSNSSSIRIHLGEYDDDMPHPQIVISDVSSVTPAASGFSRVKADGTGHVATYDSRLDVNVWVPANEANDPDLLAETIGWEVRDIVHDNSQGLVDPETLEECTNRLVPLSEPQAFADPDSSLTRWRALVEVGYRRREDPPQR